MLKGFFSRQPTKAECAIEAEKLVNKAALDGAKHASDRLQTLLAQMRMTSEERKND